MARKAVKASFSQSESADSNCINSVRIEPGDRIELERPENSPDRLVLPDWIDASSLMIERVEDEHGRKLAFAWDDAGGSIKGLDLGDRFDRAWQTVWLECIVPGQFRLVPDCIVGMHAGEGQPAALDALPRDDWLVLRSAGGTSASLNEFELSLRASRLATHAGFDRLICVPMLREMDLLEHQTRTAKTVLRRFRGRALLCDEVGLGKTIEAGLVLAELLMRGLVRSVLVLVPPSLIEQWQGEMRRKFSIELTSHDAADFRERGLDAWHQVDRIIASIHTAKRDPHRSAILQRKWDMVIIDEAHHFRNRNTQLWRLGSEIQKQFILLLTATPVQNNLEELFNLVTMLEPGLLRTSKQFSRQFIDKRDKLMPRNIDQLHELLSEVMVRNRRSTVGLQFTRRWARTELVTPSPGERDLYSAVAEFVRENLRAGQGSSGSGDSQPPAIDCETENHSPPSSVLKRKGMRPELSRMALLTLQMALGSSCQAAARTLQNMTQNDGLTEQIRQKLSDLASMARNTANAAKLDCLMRLLADFPDKMVIFTQFRATQEMLAQVLEQANHQTAVFHGGLSRMEKEQAIRQFRESARILLCTESGSEGRNLQFAHAVCNFDLPWNPMKIEQRIGRLSRIGQKHDVHVFNLVATGTIEAAVLHLLDAKLCMFELVIGEIDMILGNLEDDREFHDVVADLWADSANGDEFARRMNELGDKLLEAKTAYIQLRAHDDRLFSDRFTPQG